MNNNLDNNIIKCENCQTLEKLETNIYESICSECEWYDIDWLPKHCMNCLGCNVREVLYMIDGIRLENIKK